MLNRVVVENGVSRSVPLEPKSDKSRLLPKDTSSSKKLFWSFGFKYFREIDLFGLKAIDSNWFTSVFQRLRDTSKMEYHGMSQVLEDGYRYHIVNWDSKNCPLMRSDFNWLDGEYLDNEIEYPFCQFHVSKATGRIIGFWDENNVFQVLLLDPMHNMQPSKTVAYMLRESFPGRSEIDSLKHDLEKILQSPCNHDGCSTLERIRRLPSGINYTNVVMAFLDDSFLEEYNRLSNSKTATQILEAGIFSFL